MKAIADMPTPALALDVDALDRNIARMAARTRGVALRPHAKSHKSSFVARKQIEAGAVGVCCAKLAEAEALAAAGVQSFLITSPVIGGANAARAVALAKRVNDCALTVDNVNAIGQMKDAADGYALRIVIDVDVGLGRTGVASADHALAIARVAQEAGFVVDGVQAYGGAWQHMKGAEARRDAMVRGMKRAQACVETLRASGFAAPRITGGGTGTMESDLALGFLTEVQPGSYVFMDRQYRDALGEDVDGAFEQSLFVVSRIVSVNAKNWVTVDAGLKAFSTDADAPLAMDSDLADTRYFFFGDEHGGVVRAADVDLSLGRCVRFMPPHCDPTVNLYDRYLLVRDGVWMGEAAIEARGKNW